MGKKLIIKGADFSENGIKEPVVLEYIKATSTSQVIVAPFAPTANMRIVADVAVDTSDLTAGKNIFGCGYIVTSRANLCLQCGATSGRIALRYAKETYAGDPFVNKQFVKFDISPAHLYIDNTEVTIPGELVAAPEQFTYVGLFGTAGTQLNNVGVGVMLKHIKIYSNYADNTSLVLDAYPSKDDNNKICLYDAVSGTYLYTNDGTNPNYE